MRRLLTLCLFISCPTALAHWDGSRADGHAPISVTGDHTHGAGEWMLSYRYMGMTMAGNRNGDQRLSESEAFAQIPGMGMMNMKALPVDMQMEMHMLGGMYAPTDNVTLMLMLPYVSKKMTIKQQAMGAVTGEFDTEAAGLGDAAVGALVNFFEGDGVRAHFNIVVGLPTGSITEQDDTPMGRQQLPYPAQPGSGSYELRPGVTLLGQQPNWSWGTQVSARVALDDNDQGYQLGDRFDLTAWLARRMNDWSSVSLLARKKWWSDIDGTAKDLTVSPLMNPAANTDLQAGNRTEIGVGVNFLGRNGAVKGHRLAAEYLLPVQQHIDGPRLEMDGALVVGWQKAFK